MNDLLEQAITASRAGDEAKAHLLLARLIKEQPRNVEAWHQLSLLVDNPQRQLTFTRRALAIDPRHPQARERLAQLVGAKQAASIQPEPQPAPALEQEPEPEPVLVAKPEIEPPTISADLDGPTFEDDFLTQAEGLTLPDWLADEDTLTLDTEDQPAVEMESREFEIPDWLQEEPAPEWIAPETKAAAKASQPPTSPAKPPSTALMKAPQPAASEPPNWLLPVLIVTALVVFILFIAALTGSFM